ncbi:response regulator [Paenibacillus tarimensis]
MLKLFVADDEIWVRQGLRMTIDWAAYGIQWSGEAENGEDALRIIAEDTPDIILTDIKMPCMDGLMFMEELKKRGITAKVIFISGYNDFTYAQKAVQLGAFDYVLKPLEVPVLLEIIQRCADEIRLEKEQQERLRQLTGRIRESLPLARQRFLESCLMEGRVPPDMDKKWEMLYIGLNPERLLVVAATVHEWKVKGLNESGFSLLCYGLGNMAEELYATAGYRCLACPLNSHETVDVAVILSPPDAGSVLDAAAITQKWITEADRILGLKISAGLSSILTRPDLSYALKEALTSAANAFYSGFGSCHLPDSRTDIVYRTAGVPMDPAWSNRFVYALKQRDSQQLNALLDEQSEYIYSLRESMPALAVRRTGNLAAQSVLTKWQELLARSPACGELMPTFEQSLRLNRFVLPNMKQVFLSVFSSGGANAAPNPKHTIQLALEYIHNHYKTNISLSDVASRLYLNPSYFSRIFHQEMGETFSKYVIHLRLKKAKALLRQTPLRIYEIADEIGYKDVRHFVKTFKETEGVTPAEFRDNAI